MAEAVSWQAVFAEAHVQFHTSTWGICGRPCSTGTGFSAITSSPPSVSAAYSVICISKMLTYLLSYSMVQIPSWEADWFAASQEISHISWNPKVHYRTHKRPPPVPILGQPNPVASARHTPLWRSEWGSSLPPDCLYHRCYIIWQSYLSNMFKKSYKLSVEFIAVKVCAILY